MLKAQPRIESTPHKPPRKGLFYWGKEMSKQYGRNQKRHHRETISKLQKQVQDLQSLADTQNNLLAGVRNALGAYTAALPPQYLPGTRTELNLPRQVGLGYLAAHSLHGYSNAQATIVNVAHLLTSKAHVDWMQDKIHFMVRLDGRAVAYAASYSALREIPIGDLATHISKVIAPPIARSAIQAFRNDG